MSRKFSQAFDPCTVVVTTSRKQSSWRPNLEKFQDPPSPLIPPSIPAWAIALRKVDVSSSHLKSNVGSSTHDGGFVFPDPRLLVGPNTEARQALYLFNWLGQRAAWLHRVCSTNSNARPLSNQQWRVCLSSRAEAVPKDLTTRSAQQHSQMTQLLSQLYQESGLTPGDSNSSLFWKERELIASDGLLPDRRTVQEVLWELYELNWRFELLALDSRANEPGSPVSEDQSLVRQQDIMACFVPSSTGDQTFLVTEIPSSNGGLAADDWRERAKYLIAMYRVMSTWNGVKPAHFDFGSQPLQNLSEDAVSLLEGAIAEFYTQEFFNYFGRAATVPHRLPDLP